MLLKLLLNGHNYKKNQQEKVNDIKKRFPNSVVNIYVKYDEKTVLDGENVINKNVDIRQSLIGFGTVIGDGSIIGMGSIVTKDVPPFAIVAGIPARVIKYRMSEEHIKEMLKIRWWDWDPTNIKMHRDEFAVIESFIDHFKIANINGD